MSNYIYLYDRYSESGNALRNRLVLLRINHINSRFSGKDDDVVINWGCSSLPVAVRRAGRIINKDTAVSRAVNKLRAFRIMGVNGVRIPDYTTYREEAQEWNSLSREVIYSRQRLTAADGVGLVRHPPITQLPEARLYTCEIENIIAEYRVTVCAGEVVYIQRKVRANDHVGELDPNIRTTNGGWGFRPAIHGRLNHDARIQAINAVSCLGLDFGGVDVIVSSDRLGHVLEVNTAPQLTPSCLTVLSNALRNNYLDDNL